MTTFRSTQTPERPPSTTRAGGYGDLARLIRARGLLRPRPWTYAAYVAICVLALGSTIALMATHRDAWWLLALAPTMAVISTQTSFLGHDVGHLQVTRNATRSRLLGLVVGNLFSGLSYGWWVRKHNAHHAHPNDLETDPDVRGGVFIWDTAQGTSRRGARAWWTRRQATFFFPLLLLEAVNLHAASVRALFGRGLRMRSAEAALLVMHFVGYVVLLAFTLTWPQAVLFVLIHKGVQGLYLGSSFAPNHKGMPTLAGEEADDPLLRQVLTSRNVRGGPITDVVLGGLNYQIEHHLFPSMPRANLRHAQPLVRTYCRERDIPYLECSALASYAAAIRHMHRVGARKASPGD